LIAPVIFLTVVIAIAGVQDLKMEARAPTNAIGSGVATLGGGQVDRGT